MGLLVGLTGTMGSGKTTTASMLKEMGAFIIDADAICKDLVLPNRPAWTEIIQIFGKEILQINQQTIDRAKLAQIVFNDKHKKKQLENILHPKVIAEELKLAEQIFKDHPKAIVIVEAPLLIESGNDKRMDKVIVVTCDEEQSIQRAMKRSSLSRDEVISRIQNQMPQAEKIKKADYTLRNDSNQQSFKLKVQALYSELEALI
jgi:dephospho-CoA kinase